MRTAIADIACITEGGGKAKLLVLRTSASAPMKSGRHKNEKKGVPKWKSKSTEKSGITQKRCFSDCHCGSSFFCLCLRGGGGYLFPAQTLCRHGNRIVDVHFGSRTLCGSWFVKYNGMTAEKFIYAWIKSKFLMPKKLTFRSTNTYYELFKPSIEAKAKEAMKSND